MSATSEPATGSAQREYHVFDPAKLQESFLGSYTARDPNAAAVGMAEERNWSDRNLVVITGSAVRKIATATRRSATEVALTFGEPLDEPDPLGDPTHDG